MNGSLSVILSLVIIWVLVGGFSGWITGAVMSDGGVGFFGNVFLGISGAAIAGLMLPALGVRFAGGMTDDLFMAAGGAVSMLFAVGVLRRV